MERAIRDMEGIAMNTLQFIPTIFLSRIAGWRGAIAISFEITIPDHYPVMSIEEYYLRTIL